MANCNENKNPLQHIGTSQAERLLPGLHINKFALVDEKDFADWIVFASEFAEYIKYYTTANEYNRDWKAFFTNDISAQLGIIAIQNIERYRHEIKERLDFIKDDGNKFSTNAIKLKLNELFSVILTLSKALDESAQRLPEKTQLKVTVQNLIKSKLSPALKKLIAYRKAAEPPLGYLNHSFLSPLKILNKPLTDAQETIKIDGLSDDWLYDTDKDSWNDYVETIVKDESIYNNPLLKFSLSNDLQTFLSIEHAANHNLFTNIFDTYLTAYTKIIKDAETELLNTLESYDTHTPHYALFLSFLKLFRLAQTHINTFTQRHLDFYYKEVLKLKPKPAKANQIHVLGELVKQVDNYLITAGTALKAGKDSINNDVSYTLDSDSVINKAQVTQLKALYIGSGEDTIYDSGSVLLTQNNDGRVFASPVANSDDGLGGELTGDNKEWHPFVDKVYKDASLESIAMPKAQLGFALASHYLYLTEGERKVYIRFVTEPHSALLEKNMTCWLTSEKGWYQVESPVIASTGKILSEHNTPCTEISFTIPGSAPAIVNYNTSVHGGTYNCTLPILKIYLLNDDSEAYEYNLLKDTTITKIEIRVEVGMDSGYNRYGLKNLILSNDYGTLDASKPFMPFGSQPKKESGFVIGHKEIFSKENASIILNIEWADLPDDARDIKYNSTYGSSKNPSTNLYSYSINTNTTTDYSKVQPYFFQSGIWENHYGDPSSQIGEKDIFDQTSTKVQVSLPGTISENAVYKSQNIDYLYNAQSINGFLLIVLKDDFGYSNIYEIFLHILLIKVKVIITPKLLV